jgi:phage shock protein PspC (stress-responsive transcriptional regulator)
MTEPDATNEAPSVQGLHRDVPERKLLGVAAALARYFGAPVTLVRLGFFLFTLLHGVGLLVYLAAAAFLPNRAGESSLAERIAWGVRRFGQGFREGRPGSGGAGRP